MRHCGKHRCGTYGYADHRGGGRGIGGAAAAVLGDEPVETYAYKETSGHRLDWPGFAQLVEEERAGRIEIVPCATADELALKEVVGALLEELLRHHRKLVAARSRRANEMRIAAAGPSRQGSAAARPDLHRRTEGV